MSEEPNAATLAVELRSVASQSSDRRSDRYIDSLLGLDVASTEANIDTFGLLTRHGVRFIEFGDLHWRDLATLWQILDQIEVRRVLDLGSGYGRLAFYGGIVHRVQVTGIELVAARVREATRVRNELRLDNVSFQQGDVGTCEWPSADCICLMNCVTPAERSALFRRLASTCGGTETMIATCSSMNLALAQEQRFEPVAGRPGSHFGFTVWRAR